MHMPFLRVCRYVCMCKGLHQARSEQQAVGQAEHLPHFARLVSMGARLNCTTPSCSYKTGHELLPCSSKLMSVHRCRIQTLCKSADIRTQMCTGIHACFEVCPRGLPGNAVVAWVGWGRDKKHAPRASLLEMQKTLHEQRLLDTSSNTQTSPV